MRRKEPEGFWQSYADLAMGLMSVFVLVLILLLVRKEQANDRLVDDRKRYAQELVELLEKSENTIEQQDKAVEWLRGVFREGDCRLELGADGALRLRNQANARTAELYPTGETSLTPEARAVLESCADNFYRLMRCLAKTGSAIEECNRLGVRGIAGGAQVDVPASELRDGLESLVLQGNTDREGYRRAPEIEGAEDFGGDGEVFSDNAYLGSERARQALGHLMRSIQTHEKRHEGIWASAATGSLDTPLEIMMSRIRIESPSFGQYLAGPVDDGWRAQGQETRKDVCRTDKCEQARNLSLKIRWKEAALRKPYDDMKQNFCEKLRDKDSALYAGLKDLKDPAKDPAKVSEKLGCPAPG